MRAEGRPLSVTGFFVVFWVCLKGVVRDGSFRGVLGFVCVVFWVCLKGVVRDGAFRGVLSLFEGPCS